MSPWVGNSSDTFYFFKMCFHELTMESHLRRQISHSFLVHQGKARTPRDTLAPMEGAEPAATAVRRMCYWGNHQPDPNATNHQAYLQEMLEPCCWRGWGDTKINVKDAEPSPCRGEHGPARTKAEASSRSQAETTSTEALAAGLGSIAKKKKKKKIF